MPAPRKGCFEDLKKLYEGRLDFSKPWSPGIKEQILAEGKISKNRLKRALEYHCDSVDYLHSVLLESHRVGLDGELGPEITRHQKEYALKRLDKKVSIERERAQYFEVKSVTEAQESKRLRKERKKMRFDYGVMSRKLKKMSNKYENEVRQFVAFKKKIGVDEAPAAPLNPPPKETGPKVLVRKKRRLVLPTKAE